MVDEYARAATCEERQHGDELVGLRPNVDEHVERHELVQKRLGVVVIVDAVVCDVPRDADDPSALEPRQVVERRVVAHYCDALVAPLTCAIVSSMQELSRP